MENDPFRPETISTEDHILIEEEKERVSVESSVTDYKLNKLEVEAQKNWDLFYKRNTTKFFKDRHWTAREFPELNEDLKNKRLLEVGCGCGNAIFPLLEEQKNLFVYALDFSARAVQFVKEHKLFDEDRCKAAQCDITKDDIVSITHYPVDLVTMIFVLSAISPDKMKDAILNISKSMKKGGRVLFRDYGLYDHAMLRFSITNKLKDRFYVRQDGTRAYYFSLDRTKELFESCGFKILRNHYVHRRTVNKKEGVDVLRIFVQACFEKQ